MSVSAHSVAAQRTGPLSSRGVVPGPGGGGVQDVLQVAVAGRRTPAKRRRAELDVEVKACFDASDGTYGSPRELRLAAPGSAAGCPRRRWSLWRARACKDRPPPSQGPGPFDKRAEGVRCRTCCGGTSPPAASWVGAAAQIDTGEGPVFLATVEDLLQADAGLRLSPTATPPRAGRRGALDMAAAVRGGGRRRGDLPHRQGLQYTIRRVRRGLRQAQDPQSMGRVGCALDSRRRVVLPTLEHELITPPLAPRDQARRDIAVCDTWYNRKRLHSTNNMTSPIDYELANAA